MNGVTLVAVLLLASPVSAQIITYAAPLPVVAGGTQSTIGGLVAGSGARIGFASTAAGGGGTCDVCFLRDTVVGDAVTALGIIPNTTATAASPVRSRLNLYLYKASDTDYSALVFDLRDAAGIIQMTADAAGAGTLRDILIGGWRFRTNANLEPNADDAYTLGASGARIVTGYFSRQVVIGSAPGTTLTGSLFISGVTFANLGTPSAGTLVFCTTCDPPTLVDQTCTSAGTQTGALAHRRNGVWKCL